MRSKIRLRNNKKGISEVITVVLLTAMAVTAGALITIWYKQQATKQSEVFERYASEEECKSILFEVSFMPNSALIYNTGQITIPAVKVDYLYCTGVTDNETLTNLLPRNSVETTKSLTNLKNLKVTPIIEKQGIRYACINERIFKPEGAAC